jgi:hypothetical protein
LAKISTGQYQHKTFRFITMMRGGLISMLYGKATGVSLTDVDTASSLTLMSADIERIVTGMETGHEVSRNIRFLRGKTLVTEALPFHSMMQHTSHPPSKP